MRQSLSLFILAFTLGFFVISCGGGKVDQDSLSRIPASEKMVFSVNWKQLLDKAGPKGFIEALNKASAEEVLKDAKTIEELFLDPASKGLDDKKSAYGYLNIDEMSSTGLLMFPLADLQKFKDFVAATKTLSSQEKEGYTLLTEKGVHGDELLMGFNDAFLVVCWSEGDDLNALINNFFTTKPEKSMADNADLKSLLAKGNDLNLWLNSTGFYDDFKKDPSNQQLVMGLAFAGLDSKKLDDNNLALSMNFEKGKVVASAKGNFNEKMQKEFGDLFGKGVGNDFRQFIPKMDYIGSLALSLDTDGLYKYLESRGLSAMADMQMAKMGMKSKAILDGLTGNIVVASYENKGSNFRELPSLTIVELKDQAIIDKLMQLAKKNGLPLTKKDNRIFSEKMPEAGTLLLKDNFAIFSNSTALLDQVDKGLAAGDQLEKANYKKISEGWMAFDLKDYGQYNSFMEAQRNPFGGSTKKKEDFSALVKNLSFSAKGSDIEYVMQSKDQKTNVLKQMVDQKANQ